MRDFSASYDTMAKVVSAVVCLMLLGIAVALHVLFVRVLSPALILLMYAYSPRGYAIGGGSLVIKRLIGAIRVPIDSIREIREGTPADFTGVIRLAGSGGMFGYYGLFSTSRLGKSSWYVTNRGRTVIVKTDAKTFVLSPDDVPGFMGSIGMRPSMASPHDAMEQPSGSRLGMIAGIGVAVLVAVIVLLALFYSPGVPRYTLSGGSLTIHDRFYPVTLQLDTVDTTHLRIVDLSQDAAWRPVARTNGFANQHYQSGWYRVANGETVRLYRAGGQRLVLIPPKYGGTTVLYQAEDARQFIGELRRHASARNPG